MCTIYIKWKNCRVCNIADKDKIQPCGKKCAVLHQEHTYGTGGDCDHHYNFDKH